MTDILEKDITSLSVDSRKRRHLFIDGKEIVPRPKDYDGIPASHYHLLCLMVMKEIFRHPIAISARSPLFQFAWQNITGDPGRLGGETMDAYLRQLKIALKGTRLKIVVDLETAKNGNLSHRLLVLAPG